MFIYYWLTCICNVSLWNGKSVWLASRTCTKLSTPTIFHTLKRWHQYTDLGLYLFYSAAIFFLNSIFTNKTTLSWAVFLNALAVAPLFLDISLDIFGVWISPKDIFYWDILKKKEVDFNTKTLSLLWTKQSQSSMFHTLKHWLQCTDWWLTPFCSGIIIFWVKNGLFAKKIQLYRKMFF